MEKFYTTILYSINKFHTKKENFINISEILDEKSIFFTNLTKFFEENKYQPSEKAVDNVLKYIDNTVFV